MADNRPNRTEALFMESEVFISEVRDENGNLRLTTKRHDSDPSTAHMTRALALANRIVIKLEAADDRNLIIVGVSFLEELLSRTLKLTMLPGQATKRLLSPQGPLGTISAKIDTCEALSYLRRETCAELRQLANIRNAFAHRIDIDNLNDLAKSCENLRAFDRLQASEIHEYDRKPRGRVRLAIQIAVCDIVASWRSLDQGTAFDSRPPA
ncbi:MAG: hypothetical protein ACO1Q7_12490 [Gemmatimonas sp.]